MDKFIEPKLEHDLWERVEEPDIKNIQELGGELINEVREETSITGIRMNVLKLPKLLKILKEFGYRDDVEF